MSFTTPLPSTEPVMSEGCTVIVAPWLSFVTVCQVWPDAGKANAMDVTDPLSHATAPGCVMYVYGLSVAPPMG